MWAKFPKILIICRHFRFWVMLSINWFYNYNVFYIMYVPSCKNTVLIIIILNSLYCTCEINCINFWGKNIKYGLETDGPLSESELQRVNNWIIKTSSTGISKNYYGHGMWFFTLKVGITTCNFINIIIKSLIMFISETHTFKEQYEKVMCDTVSI